jgi:hypothetical protein
MSDIPCQIRTTTIFGLEVLKIDIESAIRSIIVDEVNKASAGVKANTVMWTPEAQVTWNNVYYMETAIIKRIRDYMDNLKVEVK